MYLRHKIFQWKQTLNHHACSHYVVLCPHNYTCNTTLRYTNNNIPLFYSTMSHCSLARRIKIWTGQSVNFQQNLLVPKALASQLGISCSVLCNSKYWSVMMDTIQPCISHQWAYRLTIEIIFILGNAKYCQPLPTCTLFLFHHSRWYSPLLCSMERCWNASASIKLESVQKLHSNNASPMEHAPKCCHASRCVQAFPIAWLRDHIADSLSRSTCMLAFLSATLPKCAARPWPGNTWSQS